jgi:hypothetical protein
MAWFQLDPIHIAGRAKGERVPSLARSVWRGVVGFTALSLVGFLPWPVFDRWFRSMREMQLYIACTLLFVGFSGVFLHRLISGAGSRWRFYAVFTIAFLGYAATWVVLWMWLREDRGEFVALVGGILVMAMILASAFDAWRSFLLVLGVLFVCNAGGYYAGRWTEQRLAINHRNVAIALWALWYGIGFGAGLGAAFHFCQGQAREILREG